jgi:putative glutamine amidotransferase
MTPDATFQRHAPRLTRRLERMVGSREVAEDLCQEAFLRHWRSGPRDVSDGQTAAWLHRTASNLAIDELRRRRLRDHARLDESIAQAASGDGEDALAIHESLAGLSAHERLLVLLRFHGGLSYAEIGELLAISAEAARKRVAAARGTFAAVFRGTLPDRRPLVLLETRDDPGRYRRWLAAAGAEVRLVEPGSLEQQLALADAVVVGGSVTDIDPALYGETPRVPLNTPDLARDARELRTVRAALHAGLPYLGICKGAQLLNIALGGNLYQDIRHDGATRRSHWQTQHRVETRPGSHARRILGRTTTVASEHHQAACRLGRGLIGTSRSEDAIPESLERSGERFALGLQWHPEHEQPAAAGERMARALVDEAAERAAEAQAGRR